MNKCFTRGHTNGQKSIKSCSTLLVIREIKIIIRGLPWWLIGKESTCQCRKHGFDPWSGKIPQATDQLSPHATTVNPVS